MRAPKFVSLDELSPEQQRFAEREGARPGARGALGGVFFYRDEKSRTYRWLVSADGNAIETAWFRRTRDLELHVS